MRKSRVLTGMMVIVLMLASASLAACTPAAETVAPPAPTDTPIPPTATPGVVVIPSTQTPTLLPAEPVETATTMAEPTVEPTVEPTAAPAVAAVETAVQRIMFAPGGTSASVFGQVADGASGRYVLHASAGQQMTLNLTQSGGGRAILVIWGADGNVFVSGAVDATSWSGALPTSQDYYIDVRSVTAGIVDYRLDVLIPPAVTTPEPMPQRIQFAPGATSAQMVGALPGNGIVRYVLNAAAGQQLTLNLIQSGAGRAVLAMWGQDGTVFISGGVDATSWSGTLPLSQDYFVDVRATTADAVSYALDVLIPPISSTPEPAPQRIQFAPGAISAQVTGSLAGEGRARYVLAASAGQQMTLNLTQSGAGHAVLAMWGADGAAFMSGAVDATAWSGVLPLTQDYFIDVRSVTPASLNFQLDVTIPPIETPAAEPISQRIQFAPGAISAQVVGVLPAHSTARHVLGAAAGQQMQVNLTDSGPGTNAILIIWGVDGTVLISSHAGATNWVGLLPLTQDYYIDIRSASGAPLEYQLDVVIPPAS
jgi:hypothetical protein